MSDLTGPLFAKGSVVAGLGTPIDSPTNEIAEAVYDHLPLCMARHICPETAIGTGGLGCAAEAAQDHPALARLSAELNNVNPADDCRLAAKNAAVVENLDPRAHPANSQAYTDLFLPYLAARWSV